MQVTNSALCIFDRPSVQTAVIRNTTVDYYPLTNVSAGGPIEFFIPGSTEDYIDVNDISLYIKAKVTKPSGLPLDATDKVGLTNLPIASLFQDVALTVGENQIEGGQMCYPYLGYFHTLMQFDPKAQKSHMRAQGWYMDEAAKFDSDTNAGFIKRQENESILESIV